MTYSAHLTEVNDRSGLIFMAAAFCLITSSAVAFRFYARRCTRAGLGADDWLALTASAFVLALNGIFLGGTIQGAITGHSPVVDDWPVTTDVEILVQKYKYGFQTVEKITFGIIKLSLLFLWKRMFGRVRAFVIFCWVMIGVIIAWSISFFLATVFQCGINWTWNWAPIGFFLTQCTNTLNMLTVFTATDVFTDFIIMFMPVPIIWKLHMPMRKKVGVTSIFCVGLFTIGAGMARMYIYLVTSYDKEDNPDFIADFTLFILWSEVEANVAMLVCCMPTLGPVMAMAHDGLTSRLRSLSSLPSKWTLLHSERPSAKGSHSDTELNSVPETWPPIPVTSYRRSGTPWRGDLDSGAVTAAGYTDTDLESQHHQDGRILARTEIFRTSEPKY